MAMWTLLSWLQKHLIWSIPGAMALGLAFGWAVDAAACAGPSCR
jgi:hypothetical protein